MFCEKCGKQILDGEKFCGTCGWQVPAQEVPVIAEMPVASQAATPLENVWMQQEVIAPAVPAEFPPADGKKKSSKKLPIIIGAAAVLVALVVVLVMSLSGWFRKNFSSPEKYFQYVAKESAKECSANMASIYSDMLYMLDVFDKNLAFEAEWKLHDDVTDLISMAADMDMSFLESGSVATTFSYGKEIWGVDAGVSLNGVEIATIEFILDILEDNMYLSIPDFMDKSFGADMEEFDGEIDEDMFEEIEKIMGIFPEAKTMESLMNKYAGIMIECINDVEKDEETIKVEGVSQDVTALTITVDEDTICDMGTAVFEEMLEDKELKSVIMDMAEAIDENPDEMYALFIESVEDVMDEFEDSVELEEDIEFVVYVNSSDEICGFEMEYIEGKITILMAKSGGKFGFEASAESYYNEVAFVGSGKESGSKLTGDFSLEVDGAGYLDVAVKDFDTKKFAKGYVCGEFTISLPSRAAEMVEEEVGAYFGLEEYALKIVSETSGTSGDVQIVVLADKDALVDLSVAFSVDEAGDIDVPADKDVVWTDEEEELIEMIIDFDWNELLDRLKDADMPSMITDALEDFIDELEYAAEFY